MITERLLVKEDIPQLAESLKNDGCHKNTPVAFFMSPKAVTKVYEDEKSPILVARFAKSLRIDIQYLDNEDSKRNVLAMIQGFPKVLEEAKNSGYEEIVFCTINPKLEKFCQKYLGFEVVGGELRKVL